MSLDTQVRERKSIRARIRPKMNQFDQITMALGCASDQERADLIEMTSRQMRRVRLGGYVGATFVANALSACRHHQWELAKQKIRHGFDDLFEIVLVDGDE